MPFSIKSTQYAISTNRTMSFYHRHRSGLHLAPLTRRIATIVRSREGGSMHQGMVPNSARRKQSQAGLRPRPPHTKRPTAPGHIEGSIPQRTNLGDLRAGPMSGELPFLGTGLQLRATRGPNRPSTTEKSFLRPLWFRTRFRGLLLFKPT